MQPPDVCLVRPWFDPVVFGVRKAFVWEPCYLARMRVRYAMVYWNPTPGAAITVDGTRILLDQRQLLLIPPGTWFQRENLRPFDHWWSHVRIAVAPAKAGPQLIAARGELARLLASLWRRCWQAGVADPAAMAEAYAVLALALARIAWCGGGRTWADPQLGELARWLEARGYPHLGNDDLARRLGMHPKAFCRRFSQEIGSSPQEWLRSRRLDLAAERLDQGLTIEEAVAAGGFADRFHFGRLFKHQHGVAPGFYRRLALARLGPHGRQSQSPSGTPAAQ